MNLSFTKMHGLGNDFIVIDGLQTPVSLSAEQIRYLADRRHGVGCDQVLVIESNDRPDADVRYRIFNADGNEVEQCGNGVRCVGEYLRRRSLINGDAVSVETCSGLVTIYPEAGENIRVDMGVPSFEPVDVPLSAVQRQSSYPLLVDTTELEIMAVSIGNPHAVLLVDDIDLAPVASLAPRIQDSGLFPEGVNVGFMEIVDRGHIRLRVYERGVGETLACGTGACGAVAAGINTGRLANEVNVELKGGNLTISWAGEGEAIWMTGPATTVYEGQIEL